MSLTDLCIHCILTDSVAYHEHDSEQHSAGGYGSQHSDESERVLGELEIHRFREQNGAHQIPFGCEESYKKRSHMANIKNEVSSNKGQHQQWIILQQRSRVINTNNGDSYKKGQGS